MNASAKPISAATAYLLMTLTALFWAGNFIIGRAATGINAMTPMVEEG